MWMRVGACVLALLASVGVAGLVAGESTRVTIDHCYDYYTDRTRDTKCTGHWTRLGHRFTGRVYGVAVPYDWQAILPAPQADGWNELTVPDAAREHPAVAAPGGALVVPWPVLWAVWSLPVGVATAMIVLLARTARTRRRWQGVAIARSWWLGLASGLAGLPYRATPGWGQRAGRVAVVRVGAG